MDYGSLIQESIEYTRQALVGRWITWLVLVLCSLPFALVRFTYDPKQVFAGGTIHWELVPWPEIIGLTLAGFLLLFVVFGYMVRIYRGINPPPGFDHLGSLYTDGIKLMVVNILWLIPVVLAFILMLVALAVATSVAGSVLAGLTLWGLSLVILIELVLLVIMVLYSSLGSVRFARTGSIREGIRFSAITDTIRTIGWGRYILAQIIMWVAAFLFALVMAALSLIPYAGWPIHLALGPFIVIFTSWFITRVYDHGVPQVPAAATDPAGN
jgi:hypothetical protein